MRALALFPIAAAIALALPGCAADLVESDPLPALDEPFFRCRVQPVLAANCGQLACHGDAQRYFKVYSRNRLRKVESDTLNALLRPEEGAANFASARAFVDIRHPRESLLLKKSLDRSAGGLFHRGAQIFGGGNVFESEENADYQLLVEWIEGATEVPGCIEPGSNL